MQQRDTQCPNCRRAGLWIEWSRFESLPGHFVSSKVHFLRIIRLEVTFVIVCVLGKDTLKVRLSPPGSING